MIKSSGTPPLQQGEPIPIRGPTVHTFSIENQEMNNNNPPKAETPEKENPVIMTSENETSSKEKREILTELDKTLMELLDVVEKVQTVDESRLIFDDSEVQQ